MEVVEAGQLWRQYILAGFASIGILCAAYTLGWSAPTLLILEDVTISPLDHVPTIEQISWIGSLFPVGAIFGSYLVSYTVSTIGRKRSLICSCLPMLIGWLLILVTSDITMIYAGRFLWGWAGGMFFTITPIYCAEIATDDCRGSLGTFLQMFCSIGFLLVYCIGPFTTYTVDAYVGGTIGLFYCIGLFFIPESPFFFLAKNDKEAASECLAKIRGRSLKTVRLEIDKMYDEVTASMGRTAKLADLCRGTNFKAIYISIVLLVFQQFCGVNSSLVYMNSIFEAAGASLDPSISSIIIGGVLVFASCVTPLVADKIGRRTLLLFSTTGTAIGLGLLGLYFILADNNSPVVAHLGFLPILALVMSILAYCAGMGPLPWAIMSEYLPIEVKSIVSPLATGMAWLLTFLTTRFFASVSDAIGMGGSFMGFAVICLCSTFFVVFLVPETKGKSFQEIQDILAGNLLIIPRGIVTSAGQCAYLLTSLTVGMNRII